MHQTAIVFSVFLTAAADDKAACRAQAGASAAQAAKFAETVATLERCAALDPNDAEGYQTLAAFYWDKAYKDASLTPKQKDDYASSALANADRALALKPDFLEALVYKSLALRVKATATQ